MLGLAGCWASHSHPRGDQGLGGLSPSPLGNEQGSSFGNGAGSAKRGSGKRRRSGGAVRLDQAGAIWRLSAVYIFAQIKLVRAKYLLKAEHSDLNQFIADYHSIEPLLKSAYGEPASKKAVWLSHSTKRSARDTWIRTGRCPRIFSPQTGMLD